MRIGVVAVALVVLALLLAFGMKEDEAWRSDRPREAASATRKTPGPSPPAESAVAASTPAKPEVPPITGTVLDHDTERPEPGVRVTARHTDTGEEAATITGKDGSFRLYGLAADGRYRLDAEKAGFTSARLVALLTKRGVEARPGDEMRLEVRRAATVSGRVVDPVGRGVGGARVRAVTMTHRRNRGVTVIGLPDVRGLAAVADDLGRFELDGIAPVGSTRFSVECEGYRDGRFDYEGTDPPPTGERVVTLEPVGVVTGRVLGADGRPISGAAVVPARLDPSFAGRALLSGEEGAFTFPLDKPWTHVVAWVDGHVPAIVRAGAEIRLRAAAEVRGVVRDDRGQAVPGARVRVHHYMTELDGERGRLASAFVNRISWGDEAKWALLAHDESGRIPVAEARTDEAGRFVLRAGGASETVLVVDEPAHVEARASWEEGAPDLVIRLDRAARLRVEVVERETGEPVPEYGVTVPVSEDRTRRWPGKGPEPLELYVAPGDVEIGIEARGFAAHTEKLHLQPGEERTIHVALTP